MTRRVLLTADAVGGVWTFALELAEALVARDVQVSLAVVGPPPSAVQRARSAELTGVQVFERTGRLEWMTDPWDDLARTGGWLLDLEDRLRPDVVHLNQFVHGSLPWRAPVVMAAHSCVLSWWEAVLGEPAPEDWGRYRAEVARGLAAATVVTAPSRAMLDSLDRHYGPPPRGRVVPNGRTPSRFGRARKEDFVLAVGRLWDPAKGVSTLGRIAGELSWPVRVAGSLAHPDGGERSLPGLRVLGPLGEAALAGWYARASIYCLPARYEPFGLSALEAGLSGCTLVLGDVPSLREVWGDAAWFVPPGDDRALSAALRALIMDPSRREALARKAEARAREYGPDRLAAGYLQAYRDATAARAGLGDLA